MRKFTDFNINTHGKTSGQIKTTCPRCSQSRKKKSEPCLSVEISLGTWTCWNCNWQGGLKEGFSTPEYKVPVYKNSVLSSTAVSMITGRGISKKTIDELKMTQETTWMPQTKKEEPCIVWNYFRDGNIVNKKYRSNSKGFKMFKEAELILYNIDSIKEDDYVIITEGEFDCMSYHEVGLVNVVSVPNGANIGSNNMRYLESCFSLFKKVSKIYLAVDSDEAGQNLMQELGRRLGYGKCFKVSYPNGCKDANDTLINQGVEALRQTIENARPFPIKGVTTAGESREDLRLLYRKGIERGLELNKFGSKFVQNLTFKTSLMYTVTGIPAHGKSTVVNNWEVMLAAQHGLKCGIFSPEHYPMEYFLYKYAEILVGQPFFDGKTQRMTEMTMDKAIDFIDKHFFFIRPEGSFTLDNILKAGSELVFRHGIKVFTIDPWNTIDHDFAGMTETQYIEKALNRLTTFKQEKDLILFLVAHPKKMAKDANGAHEVPSLYDIAGSSNFYNKTDIGVCVYRDMVEHVTNIFIQKCKYKNVGRMGEYTVHEYDPTCDRFRPQGYTEDRTSWLPKEGQSSMDLYGQENEFTDDNGGLLF